MGGALSVRSHDSDPMAVYLSQVHSLQTAQGIKGQEDKFSIQATASTQARLTLQLGDVKEELKKMQTDKQAALFVDQL